MWPTSNTLNLLLLGLIPLLWVLSGALRAPWRLATLKTVGTVTTWVGYHLSPWMAVLLGGEWESYLLREEYVDTGIAFSTLSMVAFVVGYSLFEHSKGRLPGIGIGEVPRVSRWTLVVTTIVVFIGFLIAIEHISDLWHASVLRGDLDRGWRPRIGIVDKLFHIVRVLEPVAGFVLACMASFYVIRSGGGMQSVGRGALGALGLVVASLLGMWDFSRGAGSAFFVFSFLVVRFKGRRGLLLGAAAFLLAATMGDTGYTARRAYPHSGLGHYVEAFADRVGLSRDEGADEPPLTPADNPLDAMAPWTLKARSYDQERPARLDMVLSFLWNLQPLPSEFVPLRKIGDDLTVVAGTEGSAGITTPTLAECFFAFGWWGLFFLLPIGVIAAHVERIAWARKDVTGVVALVFACLAFLVGLHAGARAFTRPFLYGYLVVWVGTYLRRARARAPTRQ